MNKRLTRPAVTRLALEPRIVFDAALGATVADAAAGPEHPAAIVVNPDFIIAANTVPQGPAVQEDATLRFDGPNLIELTTSMPGDADNRLSLRVDHGVMSVDGIAWVTTVDFRGDQPALNALLANLQYRAEADVHGSDVLHLVASLPSGGPVFAQFDIDISITPVPDIVADVLTTPQNIPVTADLIAGTNGAGADSFEGAGPYVSAFTQGAHGSVGILPDGSVVYTPAPGFAGIDSFSYTVTSPVGFTETGLVTVNVTAAEAFQPAPPPVATSLELPLPVLAAPAGGTGVSAPGHPFPPDALFVQQAVRDLPLAMTPNLYVQHSVRDEDVTAQPALFVQAAVRDAQAESAQRALRVAGVASPEQASPLFDDFGLAAPRAYQDAPSPQADAPVATAPPGRPPVPALQGPAGFSQQLAGSHAALRLPHDAPAPPEVRAAPSNPADTSRKPRLT